MSKMQKPVGVVLAGGRSQRMGQEKSLLDLAGVSLLDRAIDRLRAQVSTMVLSINGDATRFDRFKLPVVEDDIKGHKGPLAGILAGMIWAMNHHRDTTHIMTIASDTPFFPLDLADRLEAGIEVAAQPEKLIAIPQSSGRLHPAFGLWPVGLASALEAYLVGGQCRVHGWLDLQQMLSVDFALDDNGPAPFDPFFNINTPDDLQRATLWAEKTAN